MKDVGWLVELLLYALVNSYGYFKGGDGDRIYEMSRQKPATGTQCPSLFEEWQGFFFMPSHIDMARHTKAFDNPVAEHWEETQQ